MDDDGCESYITPYYGWFHALAFATLVILMVVNYFKSWLGDPGSVPPDYTHPPPPSYLSSSDTTDLEAGNVNNNQNTNNNNSNQNGNNNNNNKGVSDELVNKNNAEREALLARRLQMPRAHFCKKCDKAKPPRAHHCRICKKCVLRMDHHCPWVQNCVGALNLKFFILFLFYAATSCLYYVVSAVFALMEFLKSPDTAPSPPPGLVLVWMMITVVIALCLALLVIGLFCWNMILVKNNQTTIENYDVETQAVKAKREGRTYRHIYDLGVKRNIQNVFGSRVWTWLLPIPGESNGLDYRTYFDYGENELEMV